ncbi:MAG: hypothetical protein D6703_01335 [Zetaproteobacteria bacterium]|nr:MAG: hypothetical protein D6703_01335 [Zetaproteobacteria bacterium]
MKEPAPWESWIVTIELPRRYMFKFEALLQGESGLAVARFGQRSGSCQMWTTHAQYASLLQWIEEMGGRMQIRVVSVRAWEEG